MAPAPPPDANQTPPLRALMRTLSDLGDRQGDSVRLGDILAAIGEQSHAIVLMVPAMILVSPLSGIFGLSTLTSFVMLLIITQALMRREHLWLPRALSNRTISRKRFNGAIKWLHGPVAWIGRHSQPRLQMLVMAPVRLACWLISLALCLTIPFLELLPFTTSLIALSIALMCVGMVLRDGIYVVAGWSVIGAFAGLLAYLVL